MTRDYDGLAEIYDLWAEADASATPSLAFYMALMRGPARERVELGVGTGRIAIPILQEGGCLTGVDASPRMLDLCRAKADRAGVSGRLRLLQRDVRQLDLDTPAELVTFPFRSIGHLLTDSDKLACFRSVYANLMPGGRFVFDHYIWDEAWARANDGVSTLMVDHRFADHRLRVYDTYHYRYSDQRMDCSVRIQRLSTGDDRLLEDRLQHFEFSWFEVCQVRQWAQETGFEVEALFGSFNASDDHGPQSVNQVWTLRKPVN